MDKDLKPKENNDLKKVKLGDCCTIISGVTLAGATIKKISKHILNDCEIPCPNIERQEDLVSLFSIFDDIIATNKRQIETLENFLDCTINGFLNDFLSE